MSSVIIREAKFDDEDLVQQLCLRNDIRQEDSSGAWQWIWNSNRLYDDKWPLGWVLVSDETIVGFIGNIPRLYSYRGKNLIAGVARAFVVDKMFRSHSLKLVAKFFSQKYADFLIFSSANDDAGKVYRIAGATGIPQVDYNKDLFWVTEPASFVEALLKQKGFSNAIAIIVSKCIVPLKYANKAYWRLFQKNDNDDCRVINIQPDQLANEINDLWLYIHSNNPERLYSFRDKEAINWQFVNDSALKRKTTAYAAYRDDRLVGYIVIIRRDSVRYGLRRLLIADIIVKDDNPAILNSLMSSVLSHAVVNNISITQIIGFPGYIRAALCKLTPFSKMIPHDRFLYYVNNSELSSQLEQENIWYASSFDGDSSL